MKRITALPIKGESYLLEYLDKKILVDGGYSSSKLVPALKKQLSAERVHLDVVVCTHCDNDHAGGLIDLLEQDGITVSEVWLPGSLNDVVRDLVENPNVFYQEFVQELETLEGESADALCSEDVERVDCELGLLTSNVIVSDGQCAPEEGVSLELKPSFPAGKTTPAGKAKRAIRKLGIRADVAQRAIELIDTAERVRKIALSTIGKGVKVRWFDYLAYSKHRKATGGKAFLRPVNAKEILPQAVLLSVQHRKFVALTRANRESLVFFSATDDAHVGILFCGDSPLGDGRRYANSFLKGKSFNKPLIVTVPHHGADSNAMAYGHIKEFGSVAFWIRSGGKPEHPEAAFRAISPAVRTCTYCPHKNLPLQTVCITDKWLDFCDPQAWLTVRSHDCSC